MKARALTLITGALVFALVLQTAIIVRANHRLKNQVDALRRLLTADLALKEGDSMGQVVGFDGNASRVVVDLGKSGPSLVMGVSASCPICVQNLPLWKPLANQALLAGLHVFWVSRDSLEAMKPWRDEILPGLVIADPTHRTWLQLNLGMVPQTVVVSKTGRIARAWAGPLDPVKVGQVEESIRSQSQPESSKQ